MVYPWAVRGAHQSPRRAARCQRHGGGLQESGPCGACLSLDQDGRSERVSGVSLQRAAGARPCLFVHAGLLCGVAHASAFEADAVDDEQLDAASTTQASAVAKAVRSQHAKGKDASKCADDGLALHSFRTLLKDLGTLAYNITHTHASPQNKIVLTTRPTPIQSKALSLLALNPACTQ